MSRLYPIFTEFSNLCNAAHCGVSAIPCGEILRSGNRPVQAPTRGAVSRRDGQVHPPARALLRGRRARTEGCLEVRPRAHSSKNTAVRAQLPVVLLLLLVLVLAVSYRKKIVPPLRESGTPARVLRYPTIPYPTLPSCTDRTGSSCRQCSSFRLFLVIVVAIAPLSPPLPRPIPAPLI